MGLTFAIFRAEYIAGLASWSDRHRRHPIRYRSLWDDTKQRKLLHWDKNRILVVLRSGRVLCYKYFIEFIYGFGSSCSNSLPLLFYDKRNASNQAVGLMLKQLQRSSPCRVVAWAIPAEPGLLPIRFGRSSGNKFPLFNRLGRNKHLIGDLIFLQMLDDFYCIL